MSAIIGVVTSLIFFLICGAVINLIAKFFTKISLPSVTKLMYKPIFYNEREGMKSNSFFGVPGFRYSMLVTVVVVMGAIVSSIVGMAMGPKAIMGSFKWATIGVGIFYLVWVYGFRKETITSTIGGAVGLGAGGAGRSSKTEPHIGNTHFRFHTEKGDIHLTNPKRGLFVSGGAGSGKSKSVIEPIIQQSGEQNLAGIVYDWKFPKLAREVAGSYKNSTVGVYYVNFTDLSRSHRLNPISPKIILNSNYARQSAKTLMTNLDYEAAKKRDFFLQGAEVFTAAVIWYLHNNYPMFCTLPHAVTMILESDIKTLIGKLRTDSEVKPIMASITSSVESEKQLASILSSAQNYLSLLSSPDIFWVLSGDEVPFDLNDKKSPSVLVLGNDPLLKEVVSPIAALIASTAINRMNQQNRVDSVIILDEAPTIKLPGFQDIPATIRDNGACVVYGIQDRAQMEGELGREVAEMIISNLGSQFYFRTVADQSAERISKLFGKHDVEFDSFSKSKTSQGLFDSSTSKGTSTSIQQRDRLEAQQIMRFKPGQSAGLIAEGNVNEYIGQFIEQKSRAIDIAPFKTVTDADKKANYKQIQKDIEGILNTQPGTSTDAPNGGDWEKFV